MDLQISIQLHNIQDYKYRCFEASLSNLRQSKCAYYETFVCNTLLDNFYNLLTLGNAQHFEDSLSYQQKDMNNLMYEQQLKGQKHFFPFSQVGIKPKRKISDENLGSCSSSCRFLRTERKCNFLWWLPATRILHVHISKYSHLSL